MKYYTLFFLLLTVVSCSNPTEKETTKVSSNLEKEIIQKALNNWHKNASEANFDAYFKAMSATSFFIGTDASENWDKEAFKNFSKPHFDKGKAWSFNAIDRNIYIDTEGDIAWFDELLDTWMGVCRGSGVLKKSNNSWKIEQYVLSLTIPNNNIEAVKKLNSKHDSIFVNRLKK